MEVSTLGGALVVLHEKVASELTPEAQSHISSKNFSVSSSKSNTGKPAYPIEDRKHAISALGFSKMHGDSSDIAEVRKDVAKKYPDLVHKEASICQALVAITKMAAEARKEKDGTMGQMGPSSAAPPGMMGGPPPTGNMPKPTTAAVGPA